MIKRIKWFFQRGKRGWADCDWWGMDYYLVSIILPMLKELKTNQHGHPCEVTEEEWNNILSEIIEGFEAADRVLKDEYLDKIQPGWFEESLKVVSLTDRPSVIKRKSMIECGKLIRQDVRLFKAKMKLFTKYFLSLWD
uniref:Uncharacterized protein n=1 Tax=viral metagenome TaxID=1070528 RepID=A0A6M3L9K3_9ZZZZ